MSWNGKLLAYAVAQAGSDWAEWRVRDVATGKDSSDLIQWTKGSNVSWAAGRSRVLLFALSREPPPEKLLTVAALNQKVYFHKLGDPQSADKLIYERPDHPNWTIAPHGDGGQPVSAVRTWRRAFRGRICSPIRTCAPRIRER